MSQKRPQSHSKILIAALIFLVNSAFPIYCQQFSEIMFYASEANCEFIEIFNSTDSVIDLSGFKIKYYTSPPDEMISPDSNYSLHPKEYALILEGDYNFEDGLYNELLLNIENIFVTDDNSFGSSGMSNSSDRILYLINSNDDTVDVYTYSADNDKGYSDERKKSDSDIWDNSKYFSGTPGTKNSVSPFDYDVGIKLFYSEKGYVVLGESTELTIVIENLGEKRADEFLVKIENAESNNLIYDEIIWNLEAKDSIVINFQSKSILSENNYFHAQIIYQLDEVEFNNEADVFIKGISINEERGDIVINEIMYAPSSPECEWIEIYNVSEKEINFKNYMVADKSDTLLVIYNDKLITPGEYIVIADDSTILNTEYSIDNLVISKFPTLNNSGDKIILLDSLKRVIDSLTYSSEWGGSSGLSLEKIDALKLAEDKSNWGEAIFPTPGKVNSISQKDYDIAVDTLYTIPNVPLIDSTADFIAKITNIGKLPFSFQIELLQDTNSDSIADQQIEISNEIYLGSGEIIEYEFQYQAIVESEPIVYSTNLIIEDDFTVNNSASYLLNPSYHAKSIVVNEIHYSPLNLEPEWIELYNKSKYEINLRNWKLSDILTTPVVNHINEDLIIIPKSYLVITKDISILEYHKNISSPIHELKFANLNNDEDGIVLIDNHDQIMDSVNYQNDWGGFNCCSLERISIDNSSINKNNWRSSIDLELSTPGRINSVTPKIYDLAVKAVSTLPAFPVKEDQVKIIAKVNNYGKNKAENFSLNISSMLDDEEILYELSENLSLSSGDSIIIHTSEGFQIQDTTYISVTVNFTQDEDENNNFSEMYLIPGFNSNTVLINEVMFKPNENESEWVEIFNNADSTVNMKNWMIADSKEKYIISDSDFFIEPKDFLVFCSDKDKYTNDCLNILLPDLSNLSDEVVIYDFRNSPIDSLKYKVGSDFFSGTSLERISLSQPTSDPGNWIFSLAQSGSTPGNENSISGLPANNFGDMIITEIMFDPLESSSEFIELYNLSSNDLEIGGWKIFDEDGSQFYLDKKSHILTKGEYFVIAADSSIYSNYDWLCDLKNVKVLSKNINLTNSGKKIYLSNTKNKLIDSIFYSEKWHNSTFLETKNISLELINNNLSRTISSNWSSSVSAFGATPGMVNSVNVTNLITKSKLKITPNPFSPDNDGYEDFTFINYNLSETVSQVRIRIFDSKGRFIKTIANNQAVGSNGTIIFDGLDKNNNPLKIGIYIILFEAVNSKNVTVDVMKEVVVVARKL